MSLDPTVKDPLKQSTISDTPTDLGNRQKGEFNDALRQAEKEFKVYPERYLMATLYLLACLAISLQQNTFVPQSPSLQIIYDVPALMVTFTSLIHMILHAPMSVPANYIVDEYGVRAGMLIACASLIVGSWVRCLINTIQGGFWFCIVGQVFVGIANPFVINSLNKVSANWFYPAQRAGVTSFLAFFSTITGIFGIIMPSIWFYNYDLKDLNGQDLQDEIAHGRQLQFNLNVTQAIIISFICLLNIVWFRDKPPTPPCFTAQVEKEDFRLAIKSLSKNRDYLFICIVFAIYYGAFTIIAVILGYILRPFYIEGAGNTGILACMPILSGIIGCILSSWYLTRTQKYKYVMLIQMFGSIVSLIGFMVLLTTHQVYLVAPPILFVGLFIVPLIPAMLEFSCEINFPIGEATTTGFIFAIAHVFGALSGIGLTALLNPDNINAKSKWDPEDYKKTQWRAEIALLIILVLFALGFGMFFFVKEDLKRLRAEKERKVITNTGEQSQEQSDSAKSEMGYAESSNDELKRDNQNPSVFTSRSSGNNSLEPSRLRPESDAQRRENNVYYALDDQY